jgi:hypothetical protein
VPARPAEPPVQPPEAPPPGAEAKPLEKPVETPPEASFEDATWVVTVDGEKEEADVVVEFRRDALDIRPDDTDIPGTTVPYKSIVGMTYSQSQPSKMGKFFGRGPGHWLTIQTKSTSAVLHLDKSNYKTILEMLEKKTGLTVQR